MKLIIDNPCHENWDAMTSNDKGAFCLACQKTVLDFSKKTVDEIKSFFVELPKTETVCGRFKEEQLEEISFEHFFNQFRGWKFFQKAAVIVYFIFGFSLFGNAQSKPNNRQMALKGEVEVVMPPDTGRIKIKKDTVKTVTSNNDHHIMGGPRYIPEEQPKEKPKKQKLMGKPAVIHNKE